MQLQHGTIKPIVVGLFGTGGFSYYVVMDVLIKAVWSGCAKSQILCEGFIVMGMSWRLLSTPSLTIHTQTIPGFICDSYLGKWHEGPSTGTFPSENMCGVGEWTITSFLWLQLLTIHTSRVCLSTVRGLPTKNDHASALGGMTTCGTGRHVSISTCSSP